MRSPDSIAMQLQIMEFDLIVTKVTQVDHCIGYCFKFVMQLTYALKSIQQVPGFIFPGKHTLDCTESLFKNCWFKYLLSASLRRFPASWIFIYIGCHSTVEDGFTVSSAVVDAVQADDCSL